MTEPTTPDKLDEILKKAWEHGYYSNNYPSDPNMTWFSDDKQELTNLIQTLEQKAELYGRLHETIEAFQAGAIDADAYSKRHATLTDEIAQLEKGSE